VDTGGKERGGNEAAGKEKYGRDPRSGSALSGEPGAGWAVPATGSLGQIASLPELVAALAAAEGRSKKKKLVVVKFYAPWCSSCKAIESRFARTARANADAADFYSVDFSTCKPYCKAIGIKVASLAVPELTPRASSARAWRLWAARHSQNEAQPLGAPPPPRGLKRAASKGRSPISRPLTA